MDIIELQNDYILELHSETGHEFQRVYEYRNLMKKWIVDQLRMENITFCNLRIPSIVSELETTVNKTPPMDDFNAKLDGIFPIKVIVNIEKKFKYYLSCS